MIRGTATLQFDGGLEDVMPQVDTWLAANGLFTTVVEAREFETVVDGRRVVQTIVMVK